MTREEIYNSILDFWAVIEVSYSVQEREDKLKFALDRLALACHFAGFDFDESNYPDAPKKNYSELREIVSLKFPNLGYYNIAQPTSVKIGEGAVNVGDAIDDICDIAIDLSEVIWCWENTSVEDALWHFRQSYEYHWGHHLRELQLYLLKKTLDW